MPDLFVAKNKKDQENKNEEKTVPKEKDAVKPLDEMISSSILKNVTPHPIHRFTSFDKMPLGVSFQHQEADETILLYLRKHFITNLPWLIVTFILVLIPFLIIFFSSFLSLIFPPLFSLPLRFTIILFIFYYLITFSYFFINFITWFYNITLITQKRLVDVDFSDLVYHDVAITKLNLVEDINYNQVGFIRTFFDYGDIFVQTAGDKPNFEALAVPKPREAIHIMEDLIGRSKNVH